MQCHVQPLSAHLLCYTRFQQTEEVTETVKTQPVLSAPNSQLRKQDDQDRRLFGIGTQPDSLPVRFGSAVAQSPLSPLSFRDSYLPVRRRTGQRERQSCNTCLHLQGLLTWLMKQLTQWLTPVHRVTKKSPGRPEMVRYWFPLFPQRSPRLRVPYPLTMKKKLSTALSL